MIGCQSADNQEVRVSVRLAMLSVTQGHVSKGKVSDG